MSLNDLEKKLYDPDSGIENRKHEESQFDPLAPSQDKTEKINEEKVWNKTETPTASPIDRKKIFKIAAISLGAILFIALFMVGFNWFRQSAFGEEKVSLKVEGPLTAESSKKITYKVSFNNSNRANLNNAKILLNYSENFKPEENKDFKIDNPSNGRIVLNSIKANSGGAVEIAGTFFAAKDSVIYLNAVLEYTPSNLSSVFQKKSQLGVSVNSSPLFLEVQAPMEVVSGNKVDYVINYRNSSPEYFNGVRLKVEYPDGFSFLSSDVSPSEGNDVWYLGSLSPDQSGKIVITGNMEGTAEEVKNFKASLGYAGGSGEFIVYDEKEEITKIATSLLLISQSIENKTNSNVDAGETLKYSIQYKNNGNIDLQNVIVTEEIDSHILDFSKLRAGNKGVYNATQKMITWKASEIPGLANLSPGAEGKITFTVPVLDRIPVGSANDKNFTVVSTAKIDSPSVPTPIGSNKIIASNSLELKLNSRVVLDEKGYYKDANFENSGPLPPKVGGETSYSIHWNIINVSNDISDAKVIASLPTGVKWLGKFSPDNESITYNERTNQIEWNVGNLKNGLGILEPVKGIIFQVSIIPQINQVGKEVILLNPAILTGKDSFTNADVKVEVPEKSNRLPEDASAGTNYKVVQ